MNVLDKATKILKQPVCDNCLGRQFGQLLHGYNNKERGCLLRTMVAMSIDNEKEKNDVDMSNFGANIFHNLEIKDKTQNKKCSLCDGTFEHIDKFAEKAVKRAAKLEYKTFLVGTRLSSDLISREEDMWERVGIDYCEPLKAEINREVGKLIEKKGNVKFNPKTPDVNFIIDVENSKINIEVNPLFIYGEYQKLVRGIPQTRWPSGKYKTSVEQIIAKPYMVATKGKSHKLHGLGREDIDARCLGWRPFVLEIIKPQKRDIDLKRLAKKIDKKVKIRNVRFSHISEVRSIKESRSDKTYKATVTCENNISRKDMKKLDALVTTIFQQTPKRVMHRRSDRMRKRAVKSIKSKFVNSKKFILVVRGEAGLYIKELISGDDGRTQPSVSEVLGIKCTCKELDVIHIERHNRP